MEQFRLDHKALAKTSFTCFFNMILFCNQINIVVIIIYGTLKLAYASGHNRAITDENALTQREGYRITESASCAAPQQKCNKTIQKLVSFRYCTLFV